MATTSMGNIPDGAETEVIDLRDLDEFGASLIESVCRTQGLHVDRDPDHEPQQLIVLEGERARVETVVSSFFWLAD